MEDPSVKVFVGKDKYRFAFQFFPESAPDCCCSGLAFTLENLHETQLENLHAEVTFYSQNVNLASKPVVMYMKPSGQSEIRDRLQLRALGLTDEFLEDIPPAFFTFKPDTIVSLETNGIGLGSNKVTWTVKSRKPNRFPSELPFAILIHGACPFKAAIKVSTRKASVLGNTIPFAKGGSGGKEDMQSIDFFEEEVWPFEG
ncbi:hypothetical protein BT69DRAFT_1275702 [Atractiella rhizophila]|nr:hypothetical protein BT69DRAFT_1275702 [Atractiella rhizophila]